MVSAHLSATHDHNKSFSDWRRSQRSCCCSTAESLVCLVTGGSPAKTVDFMPASDTQSKVQCLNVDMDQGTRPQPPAREAQGALNRIRAQSPVWASGQ